MLKSMLQSWGAVRCCAVLLAGALVIPPGHACRVPPREQITTPEQLVAGAANVSVARVVRATPLSSPGPGGRPSVEYEFDVQERLLGPDEARFVVIGARGETRPGPASHDHSDSKFWERGGGRLYNDMDCVLRPDFKVGELYLVFPGKPLTWRSFEHIDTVGGRPNPDDKWLAYVREKLGE